MRGLRLKTYYQMQMDNGSVQDTAVLDQYGRELRFNSETNDHEPTGRSGSANH